MKRITAAALLLIASCSLGALQAQTPQSQSPSPRVPIPPPDVKLEIDQGMKPKGAVVGTTPDTMPEVAGPTATERRAAPLPASAHILTPPQIQSRIADAERLLKSRAIPTAKTAPPIDLVTIAALDRNTSR